MRRQPRNTSSHRFKNVRRSSGVPRLTGWHTIWHIETRTYNDLAQSEKKTVPTTFVQAFLINQYFVTYKIFILLLHLYNKLLSSCCADVTRSFVLQRNKEKRELEKLWERTTIRSWLINHTPTLSGGDIRITPSPLTNSIGMLLFVVWKKRIALLYIIRACSRRPLSQIYPATRVT